VVYLPLLVFVGVTIWIAGWRKALEITAASVFICLLFGIGFGVLMPTSIIPRLLVAVLVLFLGDRAWRFWQQHRI